jgi:hypothetical protein
MGLSEKCFTYVLPSLKKTKPDFLKSPVCRVAGAGFEPTTFGL